MPSNVLSALISYMLISSFTPGPGNVLSLNTMTIYGWKRGKNLLFGIFIGYYAVQMICALAVYGMRKYLSPELIVLKYVGAIYLIWLGIHIIRSKPKEENTSRKPSFLTGLTLQFLNMKIYFYGMTALSGFIVPYYNSLCAFVITEIIIATVGSIASLTWAFVGIGIQRKIAKYYKTINWILGIFLFYCAVIMVL